jgi:hypothetical protein
MKKSGSKESKSPSQLIDARIRELGDRRGKMLGRLRALVKEADPEVVEVWKWRGVPVGSHDGLICSGLDGNTRRVIDFHEGEKINEGALKTFVRAAVTMNKSKAKD